MNPSGPHRRSGEQFGRSDTCKCRRVFATIHAAKGSRPSQRRARSLTQLYQSSVDDQVSPTWRPRLAGEAGA
jgi:hypothetical protein